MSQTYIHQGMFKVNSGQGKTFRLTFAALSMCSVLMIPHLFSQAFILDSSASR